MKQKITKTRKIFVAAILLYYCGFTNIAVGQDDCSTLPTLTPDLFHDITVCAGEIIKLPDFSGTNLDATKVTWTNTNIAIGLPSSGTGNILPFATNSNIAKEEYAKIVVTPVSEFGCVNLSAIDSFTITVRPRPQSLFFPPINIFADDLPKRIIEERTIDGIPQPPYTWNPIIYWYIDITQAGSPEVPIQVESDKNVYYYWVRYQSQYGCWSDFVQVTVNILCSCKPPLPSSVTIYENESVDLNDLIVADLNHTLVWHTDQNAPKGTGSTTTPIVNTSTAGVQIFYVAQKNNDTGAESDKVKITVTIKKANTQTTETLSNSSLQIYPNPAKDELRIESGELSIEKVKVVDLSGCTVETWYAASLQNSATINVSALPQGVYLIKVYTDKGLVVSKVMKE